MVKWLCEFMNLVLDVNGFIEVNFMFELMLYKNIFVVGDVVNVLKYSRLKAGVFAVR